jgi:hypothetical protein
MSTRMPNKNTQKALAKNRIEVTQVPNKVYDCHLVEWFKFRNVCPVHTCKYWTQEVNTHCLMIHHKFPSGDRTISDSELLIYKFARQDLNVKDLINLRKHNLNNIRLTLILYHFIEYIRDNYEPIKPIKSRKIKHLFLKSSLKFRRLGYKPWMLSYLVDSNVWDKFCKKELIDDKVNHNQIFLLKPKQFDQLVKMVRSRSNKHDKQQQTS